MSSSNNQRTTDIHDLAIASMQDDFKQKAERLLSLSGVEKDEVNPATYAKQLNQALRNLYAFEAYGVREYAWEYTGLIYNEATFKSQFDAHRFSHAMMAAGYESVVTAGHRREGSSGVRFIAFDDGNLYSMTRLTVELVLAAERFSGEYKGWSMNYDFYTDRLSPEGRSYKRPLESDDWHILITDPDRVIHKDYKHLSRKKSGVQYLEWMNFVDMSAMSKKTHDSVMRSLQRNHRCLTYLRLGHFEDKYSESIREILEKNYLSTYTSPFDLSAVAAKFAMRGDMQCGVEVGVHLKQKHGLVVNEFDPFEQDTIDELKSRIDKEILYRSVTGMLGDAKQVISQTKAKI